MDFEKLEYASNDLPNSQHAKEDSVKSPLKHPALADNADLMKMIQEVGMKANKSIYSLNQAL